MGNLTTFCEDKENQSNEHFGVNVAGKIAF